jgi:hypothetical protein
MKHREGTIHEKEYIDNLRIAQRDRVRGKRRQIKRVRECERKINKETDTYTEQT